MEHPISPTYCAWSDHIVWRKITRKFRPYIQGYKQSGLKDVLMVRVETIPDTLSLGKEIQMMTHFSGAVRQNERRQRWITACHRGDSFVCTKDSAICSTHFVGGNGLTKEYPDPISPVASKEEVSLSTFPFITLFATSNIACRA